ncbi:MAG: radical SAM protein [Candidatus Omnitrophota bacterium]
MDKRPLVALVSLPSRAYSSVLPMSYMYLAAWLEKKGIASEIIDIKKIRYPGDTAVAGTDETVEKILAIIEEKRPEYVGFTCYTADLNSLMQISRLIKGRIKTTIIAGGIHPTLKPEDILFDGSPVDVAAIGEGENTLYELVENDTKGGTLDAVAGIAYRKGGVVVRTGERPYMKDLGELPMPAYDKIDMDFYSTPQQSMVRHLFLSGVRIFTARGCPYLCTFCANRDQKVRYRPVKSVIEELAFLKREYDIDGFYINDDTFCMDRRRTFEFLDKFEERKLGMVWGVETRANLLDEEMIVRLKKAGCIQVDIGVESGSQEMLDRVKKGIKVEDAVRTFDLCRRHKIRTFACFMVNMPGETERHIDASIALMKRIRSTVYGINITIPYIGTRIYEEYVKPPLRPDEYGIFSFTNSFRPLRDGRFRLVSHSLNEKRIYYLRFKRFKFFRSIMDITFDPLYWGMIFRSSRKVLYLKQFFRATVYRLFMYPVKLFRTVNFKP